MNTELSEKLSAAVAEENLTLELTTRCDGACAYCFARNNSRGDDMPLETALKIMNEGYSLGYRHLHLTGGEPLLWPRLLRLMDGACEAGYDTVFVNTNGHLLADTFASSIAALGAEGIGLSVSLQATEESHDIARGNGSYKRALRGLRTALETGIRAAVFTTVEQGQVPLIPPFVQHIFTHNPAPVQVSLIQLFQPGGGPDFSDRLLSPVDFLVLVRTAALLNLAGYRVHFLDHPLAAAAAALLDTPWVPPSPALCRPGRLVVRADGTLIPAHSITLPLGRYPETSLHAALASAAYGSATAPDHVRCGPCRFSAHCRSHGTLRPPETRFDPHDELYCVRVLEAAEKEKFTKAF